jgi:tetratricopeptide (TPR) repeat protein
VAEQEEKKGDTFSASFWARRASALVPDDEGALRRLLEFLRRIGDHAGALAAYDEFARRIMTDYDIEPATETQALIRELRMRSASTRLESGRSEPARVPRSRGSFVVLPFSIHGGAEIAFLREGMVELLSHSLTGAAGLSAVDPGTVIRIADGAAPGWLLDVSRAAELADRVGAELFVLGTAIEHGGVVRLHARLFDGADSRRPIAESSAEGATFALFDLVDRIAAGLLVERIGPASADLTRMAARPTRSLPAFKAYLRAEHALRERTFEAAIGEFHQATSEDNEFALAYYRLAVAASHGEADNLTVDALKSAVAHASRLPEEHRRLLQAYVAFHHGRADEAEAAYRLILRDFPDSIEARFQLGDVLFRYNPLRGRSAYEAREHFQLVADLDAGFLCPK